MKCDKVETIRYLNKLIHLSFDLNPFKNNDYKTRLVMHSDCQSGKLTARYWDICIFMAQVKT